jgi:predicted phosphodiesterase
MNIHFLSDLHLEFHNMPRRYRLPAGTDVVVLAGDIGVGLQGLEWALRAYSCPVIYVAGNHEFYGQRPMQKLIEKARAKVQGTHVHFLENEAVTINGVRFAGTTLWTDFRAMERATARLKQEHVMAHLATRMTDYFAITVDRQPVEGGVVVGKRGWRVTPRKIFEIHNEALRFIEGEIQAHQPGQKLVIVTHHAPSARSIANWTPLDPIDAAYISHLDDLVERSGAAAWIHGHLHSAADYRIAETRVLDNCRGYAERGPDAAEGYNPLAVVEI